ncbi:hypothetical protein M422DRAFT_248521 [Sphaerobolus stellatus SS14]|uniref:Uncharacterized protein n=1 Tax=Sphaerobolus stellatus (strain SS14) TaxID=990650 RepID=A0A0C9VIZ0_SPHS4|nr:hypothetical protein M422DRAFT_248521 [Sphaerobolus stellatus SS14]
MTVFCMRRERVHKHHRINVKVLKRLRIFEKRYEKIEDRTRTGDKRTIKEMSQVVTVWHETRQEMRDKAASSLELIPIRVLKELRNGFWENTISVIYEFQIRSRAAKNGLVGRIVKTLRMSVQSIDRRQDIHRYSICQGIIKVLNAR